MRLAAGLVAAVTLTAISAVPATAARPKPKPVPKSCNLIFDAAGDAFLGNANVPTDDSLDIVGGDFATNGKHVTGILKIKSLQQPNPRAPLGQIFYVTFKVKGATDTITLFASLLPTGNKFNFGYDGTDANGVPTSYTLGDATGTVAGNEIRISAEIAKFPQKASLKNGNSLTALGAESRILVGQREVPSQSVGPARVPFGGGTLKVDLAEGKKYTLGAPTCVAVGK